LYVPLGVIVIGPLQTPSSLPLHCVAGLHCWTWVHAVPLFSLSVQKPFTHLGVVSGWHWMSLVHASCALKPLSHLPATHFGQIDWCGPGSPPWHSAPSRQPRRQRGSDPSVL
jgi:hypothetical protein